MAQKFKLLKPSFITSLSIDLGFWCFKWIIYGTLMQALET